jgi:hypothetical protein
VTDASPYSKGLVFFHEVGKKRSSVNINNDGVVDISDVILTLRIALGLDPLQQCNGEA